MLHKDVLGALHKDVCWRVLHRFVLRCTAQRFVLLYATQTFVLVYAVAQLVEALCYKPEGRGFDFR
jgi:hypothetical protein